MPKDFITVNPARMRHLMERSSATLVVRTTERVAMAARAMAPGSMKAKIRAVPSSGLGLVISDHHATTFVIYKTKPHWIKAKRKGGYLKFQAKGGGSDIFVGPSPNRRVWHPGNQHPNNFLLKALESAKF